MKNKFMVSLALIAVLFGTVISVNGEMWTEPSRTQPVINSITAQNLTSSDYAKLVGFWRSNENAPAGAVLINATLNEWCVENCAKLSQVDKDAFATEQTQLARIERTSQFLNDTFRSEQVREGTLNVLWYCEAQHSVKPSFHC